MQDLFFNLSKILWLLFKPDSLFLILLTLALILLCLKKNRSALKLLFALVVTAWAVSLLPLGSWLSYPLDIRFPSNPPLPERVEGIIVLGGSINTYYSEAWQQVETNEYGERLLYFFALARRYPEARLVFTGGNARLRGNGATEAEIMEKMIRQLGINSERVTLENRSRNTEENVLFSKELVRPKPGEKWIMITSASHMPRSVGLFCKHNWPVIPYPVDHSSKPGQSYEVNIDPSGHTNGLVWAIYEWVGLAAYFITGKIDELLPAACEHSPVIVSTSDPANKVTHDQPNSGSGYSSGNAKSCL